jgi:very-short-patch-repair endonuclease
MFYEASAQIFENARHLRKEMTEAEEKLWKRLSKNQRLNYRFRRQHPIGNFITDFYCHKARLVIEIDGKHHGKQDQALYDAHRTYQLNLLGLNVLRFSNAQVKYNIEKVIDEIERALSLTPLKGT